jgi:2-succinyl-5-enolpyruvyl-6-hydroxy-3-cyclohexene-1-carboxylate synthase
MTPSNVHMAWARLVVEALAGSGVRDAVLSPGSRSGPLAIALAETRSIRTHVVVDERAAAFFALGQARVTGAPSLVVCTSGSAGAHHHPAVVEADASFVPLVVLTADRPWDLHDCGAPQTVPQTNLYGDHVRATFDLGLPDAEALAAAVRVAACAVARSRGPVPGPVHVNARFRKPLEPVANVERERWQSEYERLLAAGPPRIPSGCMHLGEAELDRIAARIARSERGLVVAGPAPLFDEAGRAAALSLAARLGMPLFAEATSQLRFGEAPAGLVRIGPIDALFRASSLRGRFAPDLVLQIGQTPTAGGYAELVARSRPPRLVLAPFGHPDPWSSADTVLVADVASTAHALAERLPKRPSSSSWSHGIARAAAAAAAVVDEELDAAPLCEARVARALVAASAEGDLLVAGNGMSVRDLDAYAPPGGPRVHVLHQRGASGIDGLVAGAAGARSVSSAPLALLVGDVALAHDLASLELLQAATAPTVVVVVNNGGGRIFDDLPVAAIAPDVFERFFATPRPGLDFVRLASAFGIPAARARSRDEFAAALAAARERPGPTLVEALVPPREGAGRRAHINHRVGHAVSLEKEPLS